MTFPPDGRCRAFDEKGMGSTVSQGAAVILLKEITRAIEDGDRVYAIIKASAINNDGSRKSSYTSYSLDGQREVISLALTKSNIDPETITYIESSSTGSQLGDPIEVKALTQAFREKANKTGYCALGALKPNIGGLDVAAGTASLIKAALSIYHKKIPPLINFQQSKSLLFK